MKVQPDFYEPDGLEAESSPEVEWLEPTEKSAQTP